MLLHPLQHQPITVPGTRRLIDTFGLVGGRIQYDNKYVWTIVDMYAPIRGRALNGIRTRLVNQYGYWSFINQRDLEVLIGEAGPGEWCHYLGKTYPAVGDPDWYGVCADELDLTDDLHTRELEAREVLRAQYGECLPDGLGLSRDIYECEGGEYEETWTLLWDRGPDGHSPDSRLQTVANRWQRVERVRKPVR